MNHRISKLTRRFVDHAIDAFLVTKDVNITYLTEFNASESWLLVTLKQSFYITDFRYILEAQKGLKGISIKQYTKTIHEALFELVSSLKIKKIGFDDRHISLNTYEQLKKKCPRSVSLLTVNSLVEDLREIKEPKEIAQIKKALGIHFKAYDFLKNIVRPGISEKEVLFELENYVKKQNVGFSFSPIIASGPNSCFPHACVTDRMIKNNEPVLIDMGIDVNGYKSDLTRMFFLGKIPHSYSEMYEKVRRAQQKAILSIRAGVKASVVDGQARKYLEKFGLAKYFGHSLGHGVGLEIHEAPRLFQTSNAILKENMIVTVEPAVYIPKQYGIRIEDMVLVHKQGCEVLSEDYN